MTTVWGWAVAGVGLRTLVLLGPVVALLGTGPAGVWPAAWLVALTAALAAGFAWLPESMFGTTALCVVVVWWAIAVDGEPHPAAILAALAMLTAHLAAAVLGYGPARLPVDPGVLRRWLGRWLLVAAAAPALWLLAVAVDGRPEPPGIWVAGLAACVAVCVAAATAVAREPS